MDEQQIVVIKYLTSIVGTKTEFETNLVSKIRNYWWPKSIAFASVRGFPRICTQQQAITALLQSRLQLMENNTHPTWLPTNILQPYCDSGGPVFRSYPVKQFFRCACFADNPTYQETIARGGVYVTISDKKYWIVFKLFSPTKYWIEAPKTPWWGQ